MLPRYGVNRRRVSKFQRRNYWCDVAECGIEHSLYLTARHFHTAIAGDGVTPAINHWRQYLFNPLKMETTIVSIRIACNICQYPQLWPIQVYTAWRQRQGSGSLSVEYESIFSIFCSTTNTSNGLNCIENLCLMLIRMTDLSPVRQHSGHLMLMLC